MSIQRMLLVMVAVLGIFGNDALAIFDTGTGRFIQRDPIGYVDGMNLYAYVASNPMKYTDPYGLERQIVIFSGFGEGSFGDDITDQTLRATASPYGNATIFRENDVGGAFDFVMGVAGGSSDTFIIAGYSNGGIAALQLAKKLAKEGIPVELGFTVDPVPKLPQIAGPQILFPGLFLQLPDDLMTSGSGDCDEEPEPTPWINYYQEDDFVIRGHSVRGRADNKKLRGMPNIGGHTAIPYEPEVLDRFADALDGTPENR